jgi:NADH-quinone oxidoreductase subunit J
VNFAELKGKFAQYLPVGAAVGVVLLIELALVGSGWTASVSAPGARMSPTPAGMTNTQALGRLIYTDYVFLFQIAGLVLLVAMIGAIVLTLRDRKTSRRQIISVQLSRTVAETLVMVRPGLGEGAGDIYRPLSEDPLELAVDADPREPEHETAHGGHP